MVASFFRRRGDWYDEIRYDSHDRKRGSEIVAPHLHLKVRSAFKDDVGNTVEEIKEIIDNYVEAIEEILER